MTCAADESSRASPLSPLPAPAHIQVSPDLANMKAWRALRGFHPATSGLPGREGSARFSRLLPGPPRWRPEPYDYIIIGMGGGFRFAGNLVLSGAISCPGITVGHAHDEKDEPIPKAVLGHRTLAR